MAGNKGTKIERIKGRLEKFRKAKGSLMAGDPIEVDGVLMLPSVPDDKKESDLTSVNRQIARLEDRLEKALAQAAIKGESPIPNSPIINPQAMRLLADHELTVADLKFIIATGKNSTISKRDVRVYARAKASGNLDEYVRRQLAKKGVTKEDMEKAIADRQKMIDEKTKEEAEAESESKSEKKSEKSKEETPKTLSQMNKDELVAVAEEMGLDTSGTKATIAKRIRKAEKAAAKEEKEAEKPSEPVSPLA